MTTITATVRDGRIEPDQPFDLPEGTALRISVPDGAALPEEDDDPPMTPEEIARVLKLMDEMEPLQMTDAEIAAWEADRQARKEWDKAHFFDRADKLAKMWE